MKGLFFFVILPVMVLGFLDIILTILVAIKTYLYNREIDIIRRDFLDNPIELIGENGKIYYVGYKK